MWFRSDFGPTGSGSGDTKASGQGLPLFRPLDDPFVCGPQARLRTFGRDDSLGTRRDEMILIQGRGQKGRIQVPAGRDHSTGAVMPALRKGLFHASAAAMTKLAQLAWPVGTSIRVPPVLATVRFNCSTNIPGARSPTLFPTLSATLYRKSFRG